MRNLFVAGRWASGAMLALFIISFVSALLKDEPWAFQASRSLASSIGLLTPPWLMWALYSWFTKRLQSAPYTAGDAPKSDAARHGESQQSNAMPATVRVLAPGIVLAIVLAFLFRYETTPASGGVVYKRDRWTGDTYFMYGAVERKVKLRAEQPSQ